MSRREERLIAARGEADRLRRQAETDVLISRWDLDPAKQYVRRSGWLRIIRDYQTKRHRDGVNRALKFLTLPGANASDIGLFWKERILQQREDGRLNVAICDRENAEKVATNLGVLGGPLAYSARVLHQELLDRNSVFKDHFPFDVINLDMCNCLIPQKSTRGLVTVRSLFRLQKGQAFLLLLTTKPDETAKESLIEVIAQNLDNEDAFRSSYRTRYGSDDPADCLHDYTAFTQIVFPKVIARIGRQYGYRTREHFAAKYERKDEDGTLSYDMVCHSFEFEPLGRTKAVLKYSPMFKDAVRNEEEELIRNQLSARTRASAETAYGQFVAQLPSREAVNVIETIESDHRLKEKLTREAQSLQQWWTRT